jgi:hypothetical protein
MASKVVKLVRKAVAPTGENYAADDSPGQTEWEPMEFPGLSRPVPSVAWAVDHEACCTLEDYLRRRTNIAQWLPRGGLGENDANAALLKTIALQIAGGDAVLADQLFANYDRKVKNDFDSLLASGCNNAGTP